MTAPTGVSPPGLAPPPGLDFPRANSTARDDPSATRPAELASWHAVRGRPSLGLIYDPGAADGLVGTETLRTYLRAAGQSLNILGRSGTTFRGTEGGGVPASLRVAVPFGLDATTAGILEVDAVGGAADGCPFLMPNKTCIRHRCVTIHDAFGDGTQDGLLIMPEVQLTGAATPTCVGIRLLCTDSGHYLVPVATATTTPTLYNDLAERIYRRIKPIIGASLSKGGRSESRHSTDCRDVNHNSDSHRCPPWHRESG